MSNNFNQKNTSLESIPSQEDLSSSSSSSSSSSNIPKLTTPTSTPVNSTIGLSTFPTIHKNVSTSSIILNNSNNHHQGINLHLPPTSTPSHSQRRYTAVSFHHPDTTSTTTNPSSTKPNLNRSRSVSTSHFPIPPQSVELNTLSQSSQIPIVIPTRNHSNSINSITSIDSVNSVTLNNLINQDTNHNSSNPYYAYYYNNLKPQTSNNNKKYGKVKLMEDIDIEKQLIISAGGKKEYVIGYILKLLFLMLLVFGSSVLIFYAL
ncbi:hypothetical protein DFJ63DRAFT_311137 [Scheffersomyces coipomensis]|uniref:uncharacterized protein n=1 Tax=Scheffersomyces coipomensis TaxID=1788519 RepID=UPI00315CF125